MTMTIDPAAPIEDPSPNLAYALASGRLDGAAIAVAAALCCAEDAGEISWADLPPAVVEAMGRYRECRDDFLAVAREARR